ncbi:MAG: O-antigen ligase family protein [Candidatus Omnitrophota bacterium]
MKQRLSAISNFSIDTLIKLLVIFVPLFFIFGKGEHYYFSIYDVFKEVTIQSIAALLAGFFILKLYADDDCRIKYSPLLWPIIFFFISILLSLLQVFNMYEGVIYTRRWLSLFVILFVMYNYINDKKLIRRYINYFIFIGSVVSLYGILQHLTIDFTFLHQNFTGNSTLGNPNFSSEFILIVFPMALVLVFADHHAGRFLYYIMATIIMLVYLILNKSRAVWIGGSLAGMSIVFYLVYNYFTNGIKYHVWKKEKAHALFVLRSVGVCTGIFMVLILVSFTPLSKKSTHLLQLKKMTQQIGTEIFTLTEIKLAKGDIVRGDTMTQRLLIWRNTLRMIRSRSILGVGIGNFKIQYQPYRTKAEQLSTGPDIFVRRTHNEHIQFLAEIGLFGIVFFYWIIIASVRMCVAMIKGAKDFYGQCVAIGFMVSIVSAYIAAFFNFSLQTPTPSMGLWFLTALMMASYCVFLKKNISSNILTRITRETKHALRHGLIIVAVCCFVLPVWLVRPAGAYYCYQYGQALDRMGLKYDAKIQLQKSLRYFYHAWETHFVLANTHAALGEMLEAKNEHLISLGLNPYHQKGHYNLANTLYKIGEADGAIKHYREAIRIDSVFYQAYNNLASIYYKQKEVPNHLEESLKYFREVVALKPDYPSGQYNIAFVLYLLKKYKEALPYAEYAVRLKKDDQKVQKLLQSIRGKIK